MAIKWDNLFLLILLVFVCFGAGFFCGRSLESPPSPLLQEPSETSDHYITFYNSTPEQCDDSPFITATGERVRWGCVATNIYPFGTRLKIKQFGDMVFTVMDRMNKRYNGKKIIDVWLPITGVDEVEIIK